MSEATKGWFITGSSRGFGRIWAEAALERGDSVVATARNTEALDDLNDRFPGRVLTLALDVTDRDACFAAMARAAEFLERIDVVVNNAGYGQFGMVEEVSEQQARDQMETNVFGALWVTQAALPYLREQGSGHLLQVSSIGGVYAYPNLGLYHASKWALEGFTQSLSQEVAGFGVTVTLVEPTGYATQWGNDSAVRAEPRPEYDAYRAELAEARKNSTRVPGDPVATVPAILELVDMPEPPLRLFLGEGTVEQITVEYEKRLDEWNRYADISRAAHRVSV